MHFLFSNHTLYLGKVECENSHLNRNNLTEKCINVSYLKCPLTIAQHVTRTMMAT